MTKVLVVDDERNVRELLVDTLVDSGYEVVEAENGAEALELARHEWPDVILLDVMMPVMDGFEVLRSLKESTGTESIPVILLTVLSAAKGELTGMALGVNHYLTKPWQPGTVQAAIRVALLESGAETAEPKGAHVSTHIRTGNMPLDQRLNGGIPLGSLTLVEGVPATGKSVICQHFTYESLLDGHRVAYFTSKYTGKGLIDQMGSLARDPSEHFRAGKLGIFPVVNGIPGEETDGCDEPDRLMSLLAAEIADVSDQYNIVVMDSITDLATYSHEMAIMGFFSSCKRLCDAGRIIIVAARSYAFDERMLGRLRVMCDAHLNLRGEKVGAKMVKMLEVCKVNSAELVSGNLVSFEVVGGIGLRIVPGAKVRI